MPRFFVETGNIMEGSIVITGDDFHHMGRTLRMKCGENVMVCGPDGMEYDCVIRSMDAQQAVLEIRAQAPSQSEPSLEVCVFQCVPKGDKMDTIVQKAVELGAVRIVPVLSCNCVVKLDQKSGAKKAQRWQRIAREAAGQCGRGRIPTVEQPVSFDKALEMMRDYACPVMFYEEEQQRNLREVLEEQPAQLAFLVGSEGGFTPQEAQQAAMCGIPTVSLGKRILRTETVAGAVLAVAMYATGNM